MSQKFKYIKGSAEDFIGAPDWATESVWCDKGGDQFAYWLDKKNKRAISPLCSEVYWEGQYGWRCFVKAQREPIEESIGYDLDCEGADSSHPECLKLNEPVKMNDGKEYTINDDGTLKPYKERLAREIAESMAKEAVRLGIESVMGANLKSSVKTVIKTDAFGEDIPGTEMPYINNKISTLNELVNENMNKVCGWLPEDCRGEDYLITDMKIECNDPITSGTIYAAKMTVEVEQKNKYIRQCKGIDIDVYDVLTAFSVTNPATAHAVKKLLCAGLRGAKDSKQDMLESIEAIKRAIKLTGEGVK